MKTMVCGRWNRHSSLYDETKNLHKIRNLYDAGRAEKKELIKAENAVTILLVRELEKRNVSIISDGGVKWDSIFDVTRKIIGCCEFTQLTRIPCINHFHRQPAVELPLFRARPILLEDFMLLKEHTSIPIVMSLPGPYSVARQSQLKKGISLKNLAYAYAEVFNQEIASLLDAGADMVRIEEPQILTHPKDFAFFKDLTACLVKGLDIKRLVLAAWFGDVANLPDYFRLPFGFFMLDFVEGIKNLDILSKFPSDAFLIAGIFDARHSYREKDGELRNILGEITSRIPKDRVILSANTDFHFLPWDEAVKKVWHMVEFAKEARQNDTYTYSYRSLALPRERLVSAKDASSKARHLIPNIPFPTSTVGSFPQYDLIRKARAAQKKGEIDNESYRMIVNSNVQHWMDFQRELGITVPVSGEFFREDMAVYFGVNFGGRLLDFVPSYENRRYRPVEYFSDVKPSKPITVDDFLYVQSLTGCPVKETITGPATLADWALIANPLYYKDRYSFRMDFARALRVEIEYLIKAGVKILQIDEPALTTKMENFFMDIEAIYEVVQGLDETIYLILHICYSDMEALDQAFPHILKLPFHQIHMEMANRNYSMLRLIEKYGFGGKDIGLGVIDVHTDRIETVEEIVMGVKKAFKYFEPQQIWLTPDCGLKERSDAVAKEKLRIMATAAKVCRKNFVR